MHEVRLLVLGILTNYTATITTNIPVPCNTAVGSLNFFSDAAQETDYGYLLNTASTDVCVLPRLTPRLRRQC